MPRVFHRLIKDKTASDLKILLEALVVCVEKEGMDSFDSVTKNLFENVLSYYKKTEDLSQQEVNLIWETANHLVENILKKKSTELIEKTRSDDRIEKGKYLYGKYWIFPGKCKYVKCDDHIKFARENGELFTEGLGIDAYEFMHAINSGEKNILPLIFSAGGIMADFIIENNRKVARFQLAQCSLRWLKGKMLKMPIYKSHVRILSPHETYKDDKTGVYFVFRRPVKD